MNENLYTAFLYRCIRLEAEHAPRKTALDEARRKMPTTWLWLIDWDEPGLVALLYRGQNHKNNVLS